MAKHYKPPKYRCHCGRRFKSWVGYQWHKTDGHPLWKDKS